MKAKKSLGQNFLQSEKALSEIIDAADPKTGDVILEIGPGTGTLTDKLLPFVGKLIAIEKDDDLYEQLTEKYSEQIEKGKIELIHGDILDFDISQLQTSNYKLVANIPYYITGAIIKKFLSAEYQPELMVLLVQKEVAERIIARDGKESILSISVKAYGDPRYVSTVKAGSFRPIPNVDSAILSIKDISKAFFEDFSEEDFFKLLHAGFHSKRKKLSSNWSNVYGKEKVSAVFKEIGLNQNIRAEDLKPEQWEIVAREIL